MNMLFSVCILYINCVIYKYGTKMLLKIMKETRSTFAATMDRKFSWNSSFGSLIFLLLVLKTSQARILVPEQQGKLPLLHHLQNIQFRPQSNGPSYVKCARILSVNMILFINADVTATITTMTLPRESSFISPSNQNHLSNRRNHHFNIIILSPNDSILLTSGIIILSITRSHEDHNHSYDCLNHNHNDNHDFTMIIIILNITILITQLSQTQT